MKFSKVSPPEKIVDCGVSAWVPGECSVPCDDTCPHKNNPFGCGGWQTLTREIVVMNNEFGIPCQSLGRQRKCGQKKCPVDCVQSKWSGWTKCTKECEGGVRGRTRRVRRRLPGEVEAGDHPNPRRREVPEAQVKEAVRFQEVQHSRVRRRRDLRRQAGPCPRHRRQWLPPGKRLEGPEEVHVHPRCQVQGRVLRLRRHEDCYRSVW